MKKQKKLKKRIHSSQLKPSKKLSSQVIMSMAPQKSNKKQTQTKAAPKSAASKTVTKSSVAKTVAKFTKVAASKIAQFKGSPKGAKGHAAPKKSHHEENSMLAKSSSKAPVAKTPASNVVVAAVLTKAPAPKEAKPLLKTKGGSAGSGAAIKSVKGAVGADGHYEKHCRENGCENLATTKGYCRLDYIKNWKKIKRKEMILKEGKLNQYIEELVGKYPDKYIDVIRQDLSSEVNFNKVIHDLELDESIDDLDYDGDSIDSLIGSIKKEEGGFDDGDF